MGAPFGATGYESQFEHRLPRMLGLNDRRGNHLRIAQIKSAFVAISYC